MLFIKFKTYLAALFMFLAYKLTKKEVLKGKKIEAENKKHLKEANKAEVAELSLEEKELFDELVGLQNEIFKTYIIFSKKMRKSNGQGIADKGSIWITTVLSLNKVLKQAFSHPNEEITKEYLKVMEEELQNNIENSNELLSTTSNKPDSGGFGYNGPIGEA